MRAKPWFTILAVAMLVTFTTGVQSWARHEPPEPNPAPKLNEKEKPEDMIALPKQWNSYRVSLDKPVGTYVALVPDARSRTGFKVQILDRAITDDGVKAIDNRPTEAGQPVYQSRVEGTLATYHSSSEISAFK